MVLPIWPCINDTIFRVMSFHLHFGAHQGHKVLTHSRKHKKAAAAPCHGPKTSLFAVAGAATPTKMAAQRSF